MSMSAIGSLAGRMKEEPGYPHDPNLLPGTAERGGAGRASAASTSGATSGTRPCGRGWQCATTASCWTCSLTMIRTRATPRDPAALREPHPRGLSGQSPARARHRPVFPRLRRALPGLLPRGGVAAGSSRRYVAHGNLPALSLVRLMRDHLGGFAQVDRRAEYPRGAGRGQRLCCRPARRDGGPQPLCRLPPSSSSSRTMRRMVPTMSMRTAASAFSRALTSSTTQW